MQLKRLPVCFIIISGKDKSLNVSCGDIPAAALIYMLYLPSTPAKIEVRGLYS